MEIIKKISATLLVALAAICFFFGAPKNAWAQYGPNIPPVEMKEYRGPGYACSIRRYAGQPDEFQLIGSKKDFIHSSVVQLCLENLEKRKFIFMQDSARTPDSMKIAYTENMACLRIQPTGSPTLWQVNFNFWAGTAKQQEIEDCLKHLEKAPDRMAPPPSYQGEPPAKSPNSIT